MNDFFDPQTGGLNQLYGFLGQIADDSSWINNTANKNFEHKLHLTNDIAGASRRVKVQILGKHVEVKNISDEQLPMAEVLLPTTAGSGHGGSHQTPNLKQGMYVFGFFKDGKQGTQPVIIGVLPNDPRVPLFGGNPSQNFAPRSGFKGAGRSIPVSTSYIRLEGPASPTEAEGGSVAPNQAVVSGDDQNKKGKKPLYLPKTVNCEGPSGELKGIQKQLQSFLFEVKRAKRASQQFIGAASNLSTNLNNIINQYSSFIANLFKSLLSKARGFVVNELNKQLTKLYEQVPPNLRSNLSKVNEGVTNTIQCVFNKIISQLLKIIKDLLQQAIEKYVNAPLCAAESFITSIISTFLGDLTSGISEALGAISGVLLDVSQTLFRAFDVLIGVLEFLTCQPDLDCQILDEWSFWDGSNLSLSSLGAKSGIVSSLIGFVNTPTAFGGGPIPGQSSEGAVNLFGSTSETVSVGIFTGILSANNKNSITGINTSLLKINDTIGELPAVIGINTSPDQINNNNRRLPTNLIVEDTKITNVGVSSIQISRRHNWLVGSTVTSLTITRKVKQERNGLIPGCNGSQLPCGPPKLTVLGGGQEFAQGNLIVGLSGRIMGVDLITGGRYSSETPIQVRIVDECGLGNGATGIAITEKNKKRKAGIGTTALEDEEDDTLPDEDTLGVTDIIFIDPGAGYLGSPDGSTGGDGTLFSKPNETIIGTNVFPPGISVPVIPGQEVFLPPNTIVEIVNENQQVVDTINGDGQTTPIIITTPGIITTPDSNIIDTEITPSYDVFVCIEDLAIISEGFNYSPNDQIIITPDNGARFEPILDKFGAIKEVRIIAKGCGFTDVPRISIRSETGINANLVPVFSFTRINRAEEEDTSGLQVVNVVDCVGAINREFIRHQ